MLQVLLTLMTSRLIFKFLSVNQCMFSLSKLYRIALKTTTLKNLFTSSNISTRVLGCQSTSAYLKGIKALNECGVCDNKLWKWVMKLLRDSSSSCRICSRAYSWVLVNVQNNLLNSMKGLISTRSCENHLKTDSFKVINSWYLLCHRDLIMTLWTRNMLYSL